MTSRVNAFLFYAYGTSLVAACVHHVWYRSESHATETRVAHFDPCAKDKEDMRHKIQEDDCNINFGGEVKKSYNDR